jgi:hypothetical protein
MGVGNLMNDSPPSRARAAVRNSGAQTALVVDTSLPFGAQTQLAAALKQLRTALKELDIIMRNK